MAKKSVAQILREVRRLIDKPEQWSRRPAKKGERRWDLQGAVRHVAGGSFFDVIEVLDELARERGFRDNEQIGTASAVLNDSVTHSTVVRFLDDAIQRAGDRGA